MNGLVKLVTIDRSERAVTDSSFALEKRVRSWCRMNFNIDRSALPELDKRGNFECNKWTIRFCVLFLVMNVQRSV